MLLNRYEHTLNISVLQRFSILIHVQLYPKYSITNNLSKTGALLIMMFIPPLVLARRHNSSIHQLDIYMTNLSSSQQIRLLTMSCLFVRLSITVVYLKNWTVPTEETPVVHTNVLTYQRVKF